MQLSEDGCLLRVFIAEADRYHGKALYEAIVLKARELGLAGATVLRGIMGYGADSRVHSTKILELSNDLPLVIEIIDTDENLKKILPFLSEAVRDGLITQERVRVIKYSHS